MSEEKHPLPWKSFFVFLLTTLGPGVAIALLTRDSMGIYDEIQRPSFAPPPWMFPVAWTLLYSLMSIAITLIWRDKKPGFQATTVLYYVQLTVNLAWPVIFFMLRAFGLACLWLALLSALVCWLLIRIYRSSHTGGWLIVPYLLWCVFALVLNFVIARLN